MVQECERWLTDRHTGLILYPRSLMREGTKIYDVTDTKPSTKIFAGPNCWLGEKILHGNDIVLQHDCRICQCYSGPLPAWLPGAGHPRAVCYNLTNKVINLSCYKIQFIEQCNKFIGPQGWLNAKVKIYQSCQWHSWLLLKQKLWPLLLCEWINWYPFLN